MLTPTCYFFTAGVTYYEFQPGDGWRYEVIVSDMPTAFGGGHPDRHALVTVLAPVTGAYVLERASDRPLAQRYVAEKFPVRDDEQAAYLTRALAYALGRKALVDTEVAP